jgi:methylmalonyl-CoA mutase
MEFPTVDFAAWRTAAERDLKGRDFERALVQQTVAGIRVEPLYVDRTVEPGLPGARPHTRGGSPLERSQAGWTVVSQPTGPEVPVAAAEAGEDLGESAGAVWLRFDAAGRRGLDPDQAAPAQVGLRGLAIHAGVDLEEILALADLSRVEVELEAGAAYCAAASLLAATWQARGVGPDVAQGCFGADPLGALASDGELPGSLDAALGALGALGRWSAGAWPRVVATRVDTSPYHDAGADDALELAMAVATGLSYLRALTAAGLTADQALAHVSFSVSVGCDLLPAVAKLRALRRLWSRVQEELQASGPFRIHARTSRRMLTRRDPWVNALRVTLAVCAAAQGGAASISSAPLDVARGLPSHRARRLARTTQLILRDESQLHRVVDPWGGSYALESLTEALAQQSWTLLREVEARGGAAQALLDGWVHAHVEAAHEQRLRGIQKRKLPLTGVSEFPLLEEDLPAPRQVDRADLAASAARTCEARRSRVAAVDGLESAAAAAAAGATLGQLTPSFWDGAATRVPPMPLRRPAEPFERLRDRSDAQLAALGTRPRLFLASVGSLAQHNARTTWVQNLLAAGGVEALTADGYADAAAAAAAFRQSGASAAVICSSDTLYAELVEALAPALRGAGARRVWLAGKPKQREAAWRAAGVDGFVHLGIDVVAFLQGVHELLEVPA